MRVQYIETEIGPSAVRYWRDRRSQGLEYCNASGAIQSTV
jgi:hypothetical protein